MWIIDNYDDILQSCFICTSSLLLFLQSDETALYKAAQYGKLEVVKLLLISGADPFIKAEVSVYIANNDFDGR